MSSSVIDLATAGPARRTAKRVAGLVASIVVVSVLCVLGVSLSLLSGLLGNDPSAQAFGCGTGRPVDPNGPLPPMSELTEDQVRNAAVIVKVGQDLQVPPRGWVIAIATALQESRLNNLPHLGANNDHDSIGLFQQQSGGKPVTAGGKACFAASREEAEKIVHQLWPIEALPGELTQVLPTVSHFEQAATLVRPEQVSSSIPCGPDPQPHVAAMRRYQEAGVDELFVAPVGPRYREMISMYEREVIPALSDGGHV